MINRRDFCALLGLAGLGLSRHAHGHPLFAALEAWPHRRCADELAYEAEIADYLATLGFDVRRGVNVADREVDLIVRDILIEVRAHLTKVTERDRAIRLLETYAATWPGSIILMICGDYPSDLVAPLDAKVLSLRAQGRSVAMIVKGRAK